jgi:hypothetical protein
MPLLIINNLQASPMTFQDSTGLSGVSFTIPGSITTTKSVPDIALAGLEAQLNAEQTALRITWSVKDDPSTPMDNPPASPGIVDEATYFVIRDDFPLAAGGTLPAPLAKTLQGSATGDYVASAAGGVYSLATVVTSEAEAAQLTFNDQLLIDPTKGPIFEARIRVNMPGATITADERFVVGLASAHATAQAALDSVVSHAWFRGEGANLNLFVEWDDGVRDADDRDSGFDYVKNTFVLLRIDMTDLAKVKFFVNGVQSTTQIGNMSALTSSNLLQPIFCYQRDAGTEINQLQVDWYRVFNTR